MKKVFVLVIVLLLFIRGGTYIFGGSDGRDDPIPDKPVVPDITKEGWVYGQIEYRDDIRSPNEYFLLLHDHPSNDLGVPDVYGGYDTTDVYAKVRLRGISVPRELQDVEDRARPPRYLSRERERWDFAMQYVWNIMQPTRTFRVGNFEVLEDDKMLEADIEVQLGGAWLNLAVLMVNDHVAAANQEGVDWDFGAREMAPRNPNVPR